MAEPPQQSTQWLPTLAGSGAAAGSTGKTEAAIKCPHCGNRVELPTPTPREVTCANCGSSFQIELDTTTSYHPTELPRAIGKFQVLELLGRGAFGTVYKARDPELARIVAVKVPRIGYFENGKDEERFLREARNAAQLNHMHIVKVHEIGKQDGAPYLVCDYVPGTTLADFLTAGVPTYRDTADMVARIAEAVAYAHQHQIIHRDLKPSNILVDPAGLPHVTDFGLARRDEDEVRVTLEGQVVGTPAYMSPEQATGEQARVDARSDIYSLGVILYEMLTGELPFRGNRRMLLHQLLRDEPRPPRSLNDHIPRDLETICLKCLAREPGRRYATAGDLKDDLRRFLAGEPIQARPVATLERLWRWCARRPALAGLAAALVLAATGWLISATALWLSADRARREAEANLLQAHTNFNLAHEEIDQFYTRLSQSPEMKGKGVEQLRTELLKLALVFYERLSRQQSAGAMDEDRATTLWRLAKLSHDLGHNDEAEKSYLEALALFKQLAAQHPDEPRHQEHVAVMCHNLGVLYRNTQRTDEARKFLQEAITLGNQLCATHPDVDEFRYDLALSHRDLGVLLHLPDRPQAAEANYRAALTLCDSLAAAHPDVVDYQETLADTLNNLARMHEDLAQLDPKPGRLAEAEKPLQRALAIRRKLLARYPESPGFQEDLALALNNLGILYSDTERNAQAEQHYLAALEIRVGLALAHPAVPAYAVQLGGSYGNLGLLMKDTGKTKEALPFLDKAVAYLQRGLQMDARNADALRFMLSASWGRADVLTRLGRYQEALKDWQRALELDSGPYVAELKIGADITRAHMGDYTGAVAEAESVAKNASRKGEALYGLACVYAVASTAATHVASTHPAGKDEKQAAEYADHAIDSLRRAAATGFNVLGVARDDTDLDALRKRPDFQALLKDLAKRKARGAQR